MINNIKFFMSPTSEASAPATPVSKRSNATPALVLSSEDKKKMYEVMQYKTHQQGEVLCEFGAKGDKFYILLEG
jgi:CRP-like cAMP-binding protein